MSFLSWLLGSSQSEKTPYPDGFISKNGIGSYSKVILNHNGWVLWEIGFRGLIGFVAIKPANKTKFYELPRTPLFINGGAGFFMNYMCNPQSRQDFYKGFYGEHVYRQTQIAQIGQKIIYDISSVELSQLQYKSLEFEVTTCLDKKPNRTKSNLIKNMGTIDFDDIEYIYRIMMESANVIMNAVEFN